MFYKICLSMTVLLFILSVMFGCTSSESDTAGVPDIEIAGSWVVSDLVITITNNEITISDYAHGSIEKYDNKNDYAVVFFDKHVSESVNQKYVKLGWTGLSDTNVTVNWYEPSDYLEAAEVATNIFETDILGKL
jgi:hypothetical protein